MILWILIRKQTSTVSRECLDRTATEQGLSPGLIDSVLKEYEKDDFWTYYAADRLLVCSEWVTDSKLREIY